MVTGLLAGVSCVTLWFGMGLCLLVMITLIPPTLVLSVRVDHLDILGIYFAVDDGILLHMFRKHGCGAIDHLLDNQF